MWIALDRWSELAKVVKTKEDKVAKVSRYDNVYVTRDGTKLVITIETDEQKVDVQPSGSAKSLVLATTGGARRLDGLSLNLTLYRKP